MKINAITTLEYNIILDRLAGLALSQTAREKLLLLRPTLSERECRGRMRDTTEAVAILNNLGTPPLATMQELDMLLELASKGAMLTAEQLTAIATFITSCNRMKGYLKKAEPLEVGIASYGGSLDPLTELYGELDRSIRSGAVDDRASPTLRDIRRKMEGTHSSIKTKLETMLRGKKEWFADGYVTTRNGHFVLPVKKEYKNQVSGAVIDISGTGGTCFIEPTAVRKLQEELSMLQLSEENEIRKILYTLTALVDEHMSQLKINRDCMETLDIVFAKAKLAAQMKAIPVPMTTDGKLKIVAGRHPLLDADRCVPLDFEIGGGVSGVVITGPNTGGKTVALKTVGLLSLMAQSGLHLPVGEGTTLAMRSSILCDIGDGQSISENLSTFSAHITNIIDILQNVTPESLVLLDELGSGTDPAEGMGIAVAILAELRRLGCLFVATTHYPEIKEFARDTEGLINARMEFNKESLEPLYRLQIGEAGESCALYIAKRLGFPSHMLARAQSEAYEQHEAVAVEPPPVPADTHRPRILKDTAPREAPIHGATFTMGDSVMLPAKEIGIVYAPANEQGEVTVQVQGKKMLINHKRLKLVTAASELYPPDYDFSIVFDTVENRKARHKMDKGHNPDLIIRYE